MPDWDDGRKWRTHRGFLHGAKGHEHDHDENSTCQLSCWWRTTRKAKDNSPHTTKKTERDECDKWKK